MHPDGNWHVVREISYAVGAFVLVFAPVGVAVVGLSVRSSHPVIGYGLLIVVGVWMVADVVVRRRSSM
jgi:hypothetical protein